MVAGDAEQACNKAQERAQGSRNAKRVQSWVWSEVAFYLGVEWSPEQIAGKLPISHETVRKLPLQVDNESPRISTRLVGLS